MSGLAQELRAVPRNARLMLLSLFLGSLPIGLLLVFFPLYLHDLGMRSFLIGGIFSIAGIASSCLLLVIGPLADRFGRRPFLLAGSALPILGFVIFTLSANPAWLVAASMLGGVGFSGGLGGGLITATFNPVLAGTVEPRLRTAMLSWAEVAWTTAMALGSVLAGVPILLAHAGVLPLLAADRAMFIFCLLVTVASVLALLPVREIAAAHEQHAVPAAGGMTDGVRTALPTILKLAVFFTFQGAGLGLVVQLLPLWFALRFNTTAAGIAPWFAVAQLAGIVTIPLVPGLARRLGTGRVILLVAGLSTALLVGVPLAPVLPIAGLFYIARSAFIAMQWPAQSSFLQGAVAPRLRGTATSVTLGCWSLANALLPALAGYLLDRRLLDLPLLLGLGCYAAATVWFWLALRHTPLPEEIAAGTATSQTGEDAGASVAR